MKNFIVHLNYCKVITRFLPETISPLIMRFPSASLCTIMHFLQRRQWHPTPVLLPGKSHGQRSLVGCSMGSRRVGHNWATSLSFSLSCIGEGNGNPLQCSCLENPREGRAWWAAIYGVTQSRTQLKQLSSSNLESGASLVAQTVKNLSAMRETCV